MMTENQFMSELEKALTALPIAERNEISLDIREYFADGRKDGKTEEEIALSLGNPIDIAKDLLADYSFAQTEIQPEVSNKRISITNDQFQNVDINVQHGTLIVRPSNDRTTSVELVGPSDKLTLSAEVVGDTLLIRLKNLRHWLFMFNFNLKPVTLNVFIPQKTYQSFAMKTNNGHIKAIKLTGENMAAYTDNGRIQLNEIAANSLKVESDNGRISLDTIQAKYVEAKTDNGRVELEAVEAEEVFAESDNGRIDLKCVKGDIRSTTDNGRITLQTTHLNQNIDLKTDNGSILVESENEPTNTSIHAKTSHGKIQVFDQQNAHTIFGEGEYVIRLKSDNGRITVK